MDRDSRSIISEALKSRKMQVPDRITRKTLDELASKGVVLIDYGLSEQELAKAFSDIAIGFSDSGRRTVLVLGKEHYLDADRQNIQVKSFSNYHNLSAHSNLEAAIDAKIDGLKKTYPYMARKLSRAEQLLSFRADSNRKPTIGLVQALEIRPRDVAFQIGDSIGTGNPRQGYGFHTFDNQYVAVPWINLYIGLKKELFKVTPDESVYANSASSEVEFREDKSKHIVRFQRLPVFQQGGRAVYENAWNLFFFTTSKDYNFRGLAHAKMKDIMLYASKDVIAAYYTLAKKFGLNKELRSTKSSRDYEVRTVWQDNPFLVPNQGFVDACEAAMSGLVVAPSTDGESFSLRPWSEPLINTFLDGYVRNIGAKKLFRKGLV